MKEISLSSGVTVTCVRVSPLLMQKLWRDFPEPKPPVAKVVIDGVEREEENPAHPDYERAMLEHKLSMETRLRRLFIDQGVKYNLTPEDLERVKDLRAFWKETFDRELDGNNLFVFISYIAIQSEKDFEAITEEVSGQSQPTPKSDSGSDPAVETNI